ncbi:MAG: universal stress protein [Adhaeribacter sp.]
MQTILVPTDFSDNAANALQYALGLAQYSKAKLILFHNSEVPVTYGGTNLFAAGDLGLGSDPFVPGSALMNPELEKIYQAKLGDLASSLHQQTGGALSISTIYQWGPLTTNLNEVIAQEGVDLVVIGTHGSTSFLDRLIGSTAVSVLQDARQPVLAIPSQARYRPPRKIVFAADLENQERGYLSQALAFAGAFGASLSLVHVNRQTPADLSSQQQHLEDLRSYFPGQNLPLVTLEEENIARGLDQYVRQQQVDVIALGLHERGFLSSLFHNSVTEQLAYHSSVPLLGLPEKPLALAEPGSPGS